MTLEPTHLEVGPMVADEHFVLRFVVETDVARRPELHCDELSLDVRCERLFTHRAVAAFEVRATGRAPSTLRVGANEVNVEVRTGALSSSLPVTVTRALGPEVEGPRFASMGFVPTGRVGRVDITFSSPWRPELASTPVHWVDLDSAPLTAHWFRSPTGRAALLLELGADAAPGYYGGAVEVELGAGQLSVPFEALKGGP